MTNEQLHTAVHPQVLERLEALFDKSMVLADAAEGLIKDELTQAASQVTYKLVAEMKTFKAELASLKTKAQEHFESVALQLKAAQSAKIISEQPGVMTIQAPTQNITLDTRSIEPAIGSVCTAAEEAGATPLQSESGITADPA